MSKKEIQDLIYRTAKRNTAKIRPNYFLVIAKIESNFDPEAKSPTGAKGLFQFIGSTWRGYSDSNDDIFDPVTNTLAAIRFTEDNLKLLKNRLDRDPELYELYMAHNLGAGGATRLLKASPGEKVSKSLIGSKPVYNPFFLINPRTKEPYTAAAARERYKAHFKKIFDSFETEQHSTAAEQPTFFEWLAAILKRIFKK